MFRLPQHVVPLHGALAAVEARRHALVGGAGRGAGRAALAARLHQPLQRAVAVERQHVEQQVPALEWEHERTANIRV